MNEYTLSVLVENKFGVLSRVAGLFSGRGYNIKSLTVNETQDPTISRMTIVTQENQDVLDQIKKHLNKLIDVLVVTELVGIEFVERELLLIKVRTTKESRSDIIQIVNIFDGKIVSAHKDELGIELTGRSNRVNDFIAMMEEYDIIEIAKSGRVAMSKKRGLTEDCSNL